MKDHQFIKQEVSRLHIIGHKDEAIQLLQKEYGITVKEANKLLHVAVRESATPVDMVKWLAKRAVGDGKFINRRSVFKMIAIIFGFMGIPTLLMAIGVYLYNAYQIEQSQLITGKVTALIPYYNYDEPDKYAPAISYKVKGKTYSIEAPIYFDTPSYDTGDAVTLYVSAEDPESVIIDDFENRWFMIVITGSIGLILTILMIVFLSLGRSQKY